MHYAKLLVLAIQQRVVQIHGPGIRLENRSIPQNDQIGMRGGNFVAS
jgi:hypothetical protein